MAGQRAGARVRATNGPLSDATTAVQRRRPKGGSTSAPPNPEIKLHGESPFEWASALYRSIVDTSPDAITVTSPDGKIILCNQQAAVLHGFEKVDEMLGRSAWEFVAPNDLERAARDLGRTVKEGSIRNVDYQLLRVDGRRVPVSLSASVILDTERKPRAFIGIVRDVTEHKQAVDALRRSEEYFRSLIESAPDLITVIERTGDIRYQSPSIERILGYRPDELIGTNIWMIVHPEDARAVGEAIARGVLEPGLFQLIVYRARHKDGSWRYLEGSGKMLLDEEGRPYGVINSRDISDRVLAEQALERSEQRKAAILETALDAIITIDDKSTILEFNPAAQAMFGYTAAEAVGSAMNELIVPPSLRAKHRKGMSKYLTTGKGPILGKRIEMSAIRSDSTEFPVEIAIVPIESDGVTLFTGHVRDLTERKRWEEEVQRAREELESRVEQRMDNGGAYALTFRELTVLHLVSSGKADKEIAVTLGISSQTVNKHVAKILHKMGAASRTEAGVRATRDGIVE
ncbi:MAG TPA: PAS domain S-box protein [Dehalococcoidia bacterium]|nr:PAS domain S-box protein [Dehalococcoidia bacterium]